MTNRETKVLNYIFGITGKVGPNDSVRISFPCNFDIPASHITNLTPAALLADMEKSIIRSVKVYLSKVRADFEELVWAI
jgi:hypothetical protein